MDRWVDGWIDRWSQPKIVDFKNFIIKNSDRYREKTNQSTWLYVPLITKELETDKDAALINSCHRCPLSSQALSRIVPKWQTRELQYSVTHYIQSFSLQFITGGTQRDQMCNGILHANTGTHTQARRHTLALQDSSSIYCCVWLDYCTASHFQRTLIVTVCSVPRMNPPVCINLLISQQTVVSECHLMLQVTKIPLKNKKRKKSIHVLPLDPCQPSKT